MTTFTPTHRARKLLELGHCVAYVACATGLHVAYVRKLVQRDAGTDFSWKNWRDANPDRVRIFRQRQDQNRKIARARSATSQQVKRGRRSVTGCQGLATSLDRG